MPTVLQHRRGTTAQNNSFTGAVGETTIDTTLNVVVVQDGATQGGFPQVNTTSTQTVYNKTFPVISGVTVHSGNLVANSATSSTTTSTGALVVVGGIGVSGNLYVGGTISAPTIGNTGATLTGTLSTASQTNITSVGTLTGLTVSGAIVPNANVSVNIGSSSSWFNNIYGTAIHAAYADLAENYTTDAKYAPGTVVVFGGDKEITVTTTSHDTRVAGVISTDPAYLMNGATVGLPVAMTGRVPCQVQGPVSKGQVLVTSATAGVAEAIDNTRFLPGCVVGKALGAINTDSIETIEVVVGRF